MEYLVKKINKREDIESCQKFEISNYQWVDGPKPETWGYMGYLEGEGLYVKMSCREENPRRETDMEKGKSGKFPGFHVCDDSAVEVFLGFADKDGEIRENSMYANFEMNADGVLYAAYGRGRKNRSHLPEEVYETALPKAWEKDGCWGVEFLVPEKFIRDISGVEIGQGGEFFCNFYKISETPEIEHYGTFAKIQNEKPNFHLPQYFARARVE